MRISSLVVPAGTPDSFIGGDLLSKKLLVGPQSTDAFISAKAGVASNIEKKCERNPSHLSVHQVNSQSRPNVCKAAPVTSTGVIYAAIRKMSGFVEADGSVVQNSGISGGRRTPRLKILQCDHEKFFTTPPRSSGAGASPSRARASACRASCVEESSLSASPSFRRGNADKRMACRRLSFISMSSKPRCVTETS